MPRANPYALPPKHKDEGADSGAHRYRGALPQLAKTPGAARAAGRARMESQTSVDLEPPQGVVDERQAGKLYDELYDAVSTEVTRTEVLFGLTQFARRRLESYRAGRKKERKHAMRRLDGRSPRRARPIGLTLEQYVRVLGVPMRLWLLLVSVSVTVAAVLAMAWLVLGSPGSRSGPSEDASVAAPASPAIVPSVTEPQPQPEPQPVQTLAQRAAEGDKPAVERLKSRADHERTAEETAALARAELAQHRRSLQELAERISAQPGLLSNHEWIETLQAFVRFERTSTDALLVTARLPGHAGPDLLYEIWTKAKKASISRLARQLLYATDVRPKASTALAVALDLQELVDRRQADHCERIAQLLDQAIDHGDERCIRPMLELGKQSGCGDQGVSDCYPCLRKTTTLIRAARAVRARRRPRY